MAKLAFSKLGLKNPVIEENVVISISNCEVEIKQYLTTKEKLEYITDVLNAINDDNRFLNPIKMEVYSKILLIEYYTNINFTEKQKEDPFKLYDILFTSGLIAAVTYNIPEEEYEGLNKSMVETLEAYYKKINSIYGILESMSQDYNNLNFDVETLKKELGEETDLQFLKEVMTKLG